MNKRERAREINEARERERERKPFSSFEMIQPKPNSKLVKAHPNKNSDTRVLKY